MVRNKGGAKLARTDLPVYVFGKFRTATGAADDQSLYVIDDAIITLGLFLLVINAMMILLASHLVTGFHVSGWIPALWGAVALALVGIAVHAGSKRI